MILMIESALFHGQFYGRHIGALKEGHQYGGSILNCIRNHFRDISSVNNGTELLFGQNVSYRLLFDLPVF